MQPVPASGDRLGHGTACTSLIAAICPDADISSVVVVDDQGRGSLEALVSSIEHAISNVDVINISLGVTGSEQAGISPLLRACTEAAEAGVVIVAAEHNDGLVSYPAHLPSVIGVRGGKIYGDLAYYYCPGQPIECIARGDAQCVQWLDGKQVLIGGNSFAAPRITGIVARLKQQQPDAGLEEIRQLLKDGATRIVESATPTPVVSGWSPDSQDTSLMHNVALYPYTKEMHAVVRFHDLVPFNIVGIADPPGRGQVGKDAGELLGIPPADLPIRSSLRESIAGADTLILGYLRQLDALRGRDLHRECLALALENELHVFSFEPLPEQEYGDLLAAARERGLRFWWPHVSREQSREVLAGPARHGPVECPVLGVFGTSASQGKFTLQLALRRGFLQLGYEIAQVGTEHHAALFGMDLAFPMGHGSTVEMETEAYPEFLDRVMRQICADCRPDLFLVGSQSGTVPYDRNEPRTLTLATLAFLLGTKPEACILVVNDIDPEEYIEDTIAGLWSVGQAEVIALAVSDRGKQVNQRHGRSWTAQRESSARELSETCKRLEDRFKLPAVQITSADGIERLCASVIDHFSTPNQQERPCQKKSA